MSTIGAECAENVVILRNIIEASGTPFALAGFSDNFDKQQSPAAWACGLAFFVHALASAEQQTSSTAGKRAQSVPWHRIVQLARKRRAVQSSAAIPTGQQTTGASFVDSIAAALSAALEGSNCSKRIKRYFHHPRAAELQQFVSNTAVHNALNAMHDAMELFWNRVTNSTWGQSAVG